MWRRINLDVGEQVRIGEALVTLEYKSGRRARLHISTDNDLKIEHIKSDAAPNHRGKTIFRELDNSAAIG
jgi:hypothetical protein